LTFPQSMEKPLISSLIKCLAFWLAVTQDLLDLEQVDAGFDQMGGVTVTKAMRSNLFFIPHAATTLHRVFCTPPRSSGLVAR
jgi:hypothetical protein